MHTSLIGSRSEGLWITLLLYALLPGLLPYGCAGVEFVEHHTVNSPFELKRSSSDPEPIVIVLLLCGSWARMDVEQGGSLCLHA